MLRRPGHRDRPSAIAERRGKGHDARGGLRDDGRWRHAASAAPRLLRVLVGAGRGRLWHPLSGRARELPSAATRCHPLPSAAIRCHPLPLTTCSTLGLTHCHALPPAATRCHPLPPAATRLLCLGCSARLLCLTPPDWLLQIGSLDPTSCTPASDWALWHAPNLIAITMCTARAT